MKGILKVVGFVIGMMAWGATLQLSDQDGDGVFMGFLFYGMFSISVLIAWCELKALLLKLAGK